MCSTPNRPENEGSLLTRVVAMFVKKIFKWLATSSLSVKRVSSDLMFMFENLV